MVYYLKIDTDFWLRVVNMFSLLNIKKIISHSALPRDIAICTDQQSIQNSLKDPKKEYICVVEESTYREPSSRSKKDQKSHPYYSIVIVPRSTLEAYGDYAQFSPNHIESGEVIFMMTFFITEKSVYFDYVGIAPEYRGKRINTECWLNLLEMLLNEGQIDKTFLVESDANHIAVWKFFNKDSLGEPPSFEESSVKCVTNVSDLICAHRSSVKKPKQDSADTIIEKTMNQFKNIKMDGSLNMSAKEQARECIIDGLSLLKEITDLKKLHMLLADEIFKTKIIAADELKALIDNRILEIGYAPKMKFFPNKPRSETKPTPDVGINIDEQSSSPRSKKS